jgi:hypothetical protein
MKTFFKLTCAFILLLSTTEAKTKTYPAIEYVIPVMDLTAETIPFFLAGMYPNMAVELKEGAFIPIQFLLNHKFFSLKCDPNLGVKINTRCFLRVNNKKPLMSLDLIDWVSPVEFCTLVPSIQISKDKSTVIVEANVVESSKEDEWD